MKILIQSRSYSHDYAWYEIESNGNVVPLPLDQRYRTIDTFYRLTPPQSCYTSATLLQGLLTDNTPTYALLLVGLDARKRAQHNRHISINLWVESETPQAVYNLAAAFMQEKWPPDNETLSQFRSVAEAAVGAGIRLLVWSRKISEWKQKCKEWEKNRKNNADTPRPVCPIDEDHPPETCQYGRLLRTYLSEHSSTPTPVLTSTKARGSRLVACYDQTRVSEMLSWIAKSPSPGEIQAMAIAPWGSLKDKDEEQQWDSVRRDLRDQIPLLLVPDGPEDWTHTEEFRQPCEPQKPRELPRSREESKRPRQETGYPESITWDLQQGDGAPRAPHYAANKGLISKIGAALTVGAVAAFIALGFFLARQ